jgi:heme-degrading monooxygenase HmoA
MSVVKINALKIPPQAGDEVVKRFADRLDELARVDGFEGFELLRPTGENEPRWFVYSRWRDEAAFQAWRTSDTFARGHAGASSGPGAGAGTTGHHGGGGHAGGGHGGPPQGGPLATGSELLEFEVAASADPAP